jgi:hypothetical protein
MRTSSSWGASHAEVQADNICSLVRRDHRHARDWGLREKLQPSMKASLVRSSPTRCSVSAPARPKPLASKTKKASKDAVATTVGVIVFWPALFMIGGNDQTTAELGRLRGDMEAIEQVSVRKRCNIQFQRPGPA